MPDEGQIELRWLVAVLRRWLWLIVGCTLLAAAGAFVVTSWTPPAYQSSTTLLVQPSADRRTSEYSLLMAGERMALTYGKMLTGRSVLEEVISRANLSMSPGALAGLIQVEPIKDTQLLRLTVTDSSPARAALLANTLAEVFIEQVETLQAERYSGSLKNTEDKMEALQASMDQTQSEIDALSATKVQAEAELLRLSALLSEHRASYQTFRQSYQDLSMAETQLAHTVHVVAAAHVSESVISSPDGVHIVAPAKVLEDAGQAYHRATTMLLIERGSVPGTDSFSINTYGQILAGQPVMQETIARLALDETPASLAERVRVRSDPDTELLWLDVQDTESARAVLLADTIATVFIDQVTAILADPYTERLKTVQARMDELPPLIEDVQSRIDALNASKIQAETQLTRLETLLSEQRSDYRTHQQDAHEARLTAAEAADSVVVTEVAQVPRGPVSRRTLFTAIAASLGMMLSAGVALFLAHLDDKIRTREDVRRSLNLDTLAIIGQLDKKGDDLVMLRQPTSYVAEAFRVLAASVRLFRVDQPVRVLLVTSPGPGEGKSTVTANLAVALAETGLSVVAIDADLRRPRLHKIFGASSTPGLTNLLLKESPSADGKLQKTEANKLQLLASGPLPPRPGELLSSQKMRHLVGQLSLKADMLLIDSPPALSLADATNLASLADGVLLVLQAGRTHGQAARDAVEGLCRLQAPLLGAVLNAVPISDQAYYEYYEYESTREDHGKPARAAAAASPRAKPGK